MRVCHPMFLFLPQLYSILPTVPIVIQLARNYCLPCCPITFTASGTFAALYTIGKIQAQLACTAVAYVGYVCEIFTVCAYQSGRAALLRWTPPRTGTRSRSDGRSFWSSHCVRNTSCSARNPICRKSILQLLCFLWCCAPPTYQYTLLRPSLLPLCVM